MTDHNEQSTLVREGRIQQIIDAALCVYLRVGYHGADMESVAQEAHLTKGMVLYYFASKKDLYATLFSKMFADNLSFSDALLHASQAMPPLDQIIHYMYGMYLTHKSHPRIVPFFARIPLDIHAVFDPSRTEGAMLPVHMHADVLAKLIAQGIHADIIPNVAPYQAAHAFWCVFCAHVFSYPLLFPDAPVTSSTQIGAFREAVRFGFQGLRIDYRLWNTRFEKVVAQPQDGFPRYQGL